MSSQSANHPDFVPAKKSLDSVFSSTDQHIKMHNLIGLWAGDSLKAFDTLHVSEGA